MQEGELDNSSDAAGISLEDSQTALLQELTENDPVSQSLEKAKRLEGKERYVFAIKEYDDLLKRINTNALAVSSRLHAEILCKRARCWLSLGVPNKATSDLDDAEELCGNISEHNLLLYVRANELQDKIHIAFYYAILYRVKLGTERKKAEEVVGPIRKKVKLHFFWNVSEVCKPLMDLGIKHFENKETEIAVELFIEVASLNERSFDAYEYCAKCYMKLGDITNANKNCNRALEYTCRKSRAAFAIKVEILLKKEEFQIALEHAKEWQRIDPENDEVQTKIEELERVCNAIKEGQKVQKEKSQQQKKKPGSGSPAVQKKAKFKSSKERNREEWKRQQEEIQIGKELMEKQEQAEKCRKQQEKKHQALHSQYPPCDVAAALAHDPNFPKESPRDQAPQEQRQNKTRRKTKNLRRHKSEPELHESEEGVVLGANSGEGRRGSTTSVSTRPSQSSDTSSWEIVKKQAETENSLYTVCKHFVRTSRRDESSTSSPDKLCDVCGESAAKPLNAFWNRFKGEWQVIRERPDSVNGPFQRCERYDSDLPCQRTPCNLAHGEMEHTAWTKGTRSLPASSAPETNRGGKKDAVPRLDKWRQEFKGKHRPIQRIVWRGNYQECHWFKKGTCKFGQRCIYAHGAKELQEWKDHYTRMTAQEQKEQNEENSQNKAERRSEDGTSKYRLRQLVISLDGIKATCEPKELKVPLEVMDDTSSPYTYRWTIRLQYNSSQVGHLQEVILLHRYHNTYRLTDISLEICGQPTHFEDLNQLQYSFPPALHVSGECIVEVSVSFLSHRFGSFPQCLALNFGQESHLSLEMNVDVGPKSLIKKATKLKNKLRFNKPIWIESSKHVIMFEPRPPVMTKETDKLLGKFKLPTRPDVIVPSQLMTDDAELNPDNYRRVMHQLLFMEEHSMRQKISRFNDKNVTMVTSQILNSNDGMKFAQGGELFGRFSVPYSISPDGAAGRLLLRTKGSVYLAFNESTNESAKDAKEVVYESLIEEMEDDCVTVRLSARCCQELSLRARSDVKVEAQFQINRIPLCEMHDNIDRLRPEHNRILFPALSDNLARQQVALSSSLDSKLNKRQRHVIQAIASPLCDLSPPLTVFGPFGTGKTYTLSQAVHQVVLDGNNRVLICTHSNSAADIHVEHLNRYLKQTGKKDYKPLRIYPVMRQLSTVSDTVKKYCLIKEGSFRPPTRDDVIGQRVVVTTLTASRLLFDKGLNGGFFSHIFIDEAAQALETETLAPLTLAGGKTKVVFAGDHMQMNPDVFSEDAIEWGLQTSLHQRLSHLYNSSDNESLKSNLIHLTENYRSHKDILQFPSDMFYGGGLISRVKPPLHPKLGPLAFYAATGVEEMEDDQELYRNLAEVNEVVRQVEKLVNDWPDVWGPVDLTQVGVVAPYRYQVRTIRDRLRKAKLSGVRVETVHNVQGKEFRALFISTVRTAHTCREVKRLQRSISQDSRVYFEFLTDPKLLNTAFTRAQSLVAVVGDPFSLRTVGDCQVVWEELINRCHAKGTLFGVRLQELQDEIATSGLDVNAPEFTPGGTLKSGSNFDSREIAPMGGSVLSVQEEESLPNAAGNQIDVCKSSSDEESSDRESSDSEEDEDQGNVIEVDDIIRAFREECNETRKRDVENEARKQSAGAYSERTVGSQVDLGYHRDMTERTKRLLHQDYTPESLTGLLRDSPHSHIKCRLRINLQKYRQIYGEVQDTETEDILIKGQPRRVLERDTVVVKLNKERKGLAESVINEGNLMLPVTRQDDSGRKPEKEKETGNVVGVLHNMVEPEGRLYVCKIQREYPDRMIPINKSMSVIKVHRSKTGGEHSVEVYKRAKAKEQTKLKRWKTVPFSDNFFFVVQYLKWEDGFPRPLGIVTKWLPKGDTLTHAINILDTEYGVQKRFPKVVVRELKERLKSADIPGKERKERLRVDEAFTIDPPGSEDLDDALTVQETADGDLKVGIHIADVSFYVKEGSELDKEAKERCTSHYPGNDVESIPMLPRELSEGLCSLLPGRDRLTMSIFLNLDKSGKVQGKPEFRRTIMRSSCRLTYSEAQKIIFQENVESASESVAESIRTLHKIAETRRKARLGDAALNPSEDQDGDSEAHQLVEEMMVLANQTVATFLKEKSPESALLRTQLPPKSHRLREWKEKYGTFAKYSFSLKKHIAEEDNKSSPEEKFAILSSTWSNMVDAVRKQDNRKLCHLICDDRIHPQLSVARANFIRIQAKAEYFCTGKPESDQQGVHFSMQSEYTHFTSPIRRYFDIMVHRQLLSLCNAETVGQDDDTQELATACRRCTFLSENAKKFEKECKRAYIADKLKKRSRGTMAFISALEKGVIELQVASRKEDLLTGKERKIQISHLGPIKQPEDDEMAQETRLEWCLRLYLAPHLTAGSDNIPRDIAEIGRILGLGQQMNDLVIEITEDMWRNILDLLKSGNSQGLTEIILKADEAMEKRDQLLVKPTASSKGKEDMKHFYTKSSLFKTGGVVMVQLAPRPSYGLLAPDIQLFQLTPQMSICLEHRRHARHCFANNITEEASKEIYESLDQYIDAWKPVLAVEAARHAVEADDVFTILGMKLNWNQESNESVTAPLELGSGYCNLRHIEFSVGDLVCARASYQVESTEENDSPSESNNVGKPEASKDARTLTRLVKSCWVGHCIVTKAKEGEVRMKLHQHSCDMPAEIFERTVDGWDCEVIRLSIPHRRMYQTLVESLKKGTPLVHSICLGTPIERDPSLLEPPSDELSISVLHPNSGFKPLNPYQVTAIREALKKPFTLIQGPPGSGKTVTGVHIAAWFAAINRLKHGVYGDYHEEVDEDDYPIGEVPVEKVFYCGPSNKSVDVVAEYLLKVPDVKILRIYGELLEREEFPIPNTLTTGRRTRTKEELKVPDSLKSVSLHHVIRHETSPYARKLAMYEEEFRDPNLQREKLDSMIAEYRKVIDDAEIWAVRRRGVQIVLCTCTAAGSPRVVKLCHGAAQCIVDECGMSMEPETLIPITCSRAKQVVLIGDHKQLQAVVKDDQAKMFGLEKSLFERYAKKALMLELQYRMHPAICDFPSTQFYEGKLKTADSVKERAPSRVKFWPAVDPRGQPVPLVFCHVQGTEDALVVTTEEGSERSKSNKEEQRQTVRLAKMLMKDYKVKPDDVVVLSPYRAQCHNIREELHQSGYKIPVMSVVKSQGSEWDHVILSLVRSLPEEEIEYQPSTRWLEENLGFLTDEHQINVALTRARRGLCIIGNKNLLRVHEMWNNLITDYEEKNCCVEGNTWPSA